MVEARGARILISDRGEGRIWEPDRDVPLVWYDDSTPDFPRAPYLAPAQEAIAEEMRSTLGPVKRPDPRKHLEATIQHVVGQALASYKATGRVRWPQSVERVLGEIARSTNDPSLLSDQGGVEQVIKQGKAFARHITENAAKY